MARKKKTKTKKAEKRSGIYLALSPGKQKPKQVKRAKAESKEYEGFRRLLQALWYYDGPGQTAKDLKKTGKKKTRADIARDLIKVGKLKPIFQSGSLPKRLKPGSEKKSKKRVKTTPEEKKAVLKAARKMLKKQEKARKKREKESALMPLAEELDYRVRGVLNLVRRVLSDSDSLKAIINPTRISKRRKKALREIKNLLEKE